MQHRLKIEHCPKYDDCNAPICPLDKYRKQRTHNKDDSMCFHLREVVKDEAQGVPISERRCDPFYDAAVLVWSDRDSLATPLVKQLQRASKTGRKRFRKEDTPETAEQVSNDEWMDTDLAIINAADKPHLEGALRV